MSGDGDLAALTVQLARDPSSLVFLPLGEALRRRGELESALPIAEHGVAWYPEMSGAWDLLARVRSDRGDGDLAFDAWTTVLRLDPEHAGAHKGLAFLAYRAGELERSLRHLRKALELYANLRPVGNLPGVDARFSGVDLVIVRENTEGLFSGRGAPPTGSADEAGDLMRITRRASERLFRGAFELARKRRRRVTLVDKANVLPSMVFFRRIFDEIAVDYPDVQTERVYVDAAALYLIRQPQRFDVLVTENMFGDILSDLAAGLVGGMGLAPSGDIGETCAVFQPAHGTAPDIAGRGIANPIATVLSVALMLEWFDRPDTTAAAARIRRAVETVLSDPARRFPVELDPPTTVDVGLDVTYRDSNLWLTDSSLRVGANSAHVYRSAVGFDLQAIPSSADVTSASYTVSSGQIARALASGRCRPRASSGPLIRRLPASWTSRASSRRSWTPPRASPALGTQRWACSATIRRSPASSRTAPARRRSRRSGTTRRARACWAC